MILCVGEILADMIGTENNGVFSYERKAGGAPLNVACAIKKFGGESAFVGSVGDDLIGKFLVQTVEKCGVTSCIQCDKTHNTTLAFVNLDANGERSFCFYRKNTADFLLPNIPKQMLDSASIVHFGSLMISEKVGCKYLEKQMKAAAKAGKKVSFDVNFRSDIFPDEQTAVAIYKRFIQLADIVKFSEDEAQLFTWQYVNSLAETKLVCVTLGSQGSKWMYRDSSGTVPSIKVVPVDTTGAGDAFYGGFLTKIDGYEHYDAQLLNSACAFANVCGALNTLGRGAIDFLPTTEEINKRLIEIG